MNSEGKCLFCKKTVNKIGMQKHLKAHFAEMATKGAPVGTSYLMKIEGRASYQKVYFLMLWVSNEAIMGDIDYFLRHIWLECCGHGSRFTDSSYKKNLKMLDGLETEMYQAWTQGGKAKFEELEKELMNKTEELDNYCEMDMCVDQLYKDQKIFYDYDFGTATSLVMTVVDILPIVLPITNDEEIVLLSRNEPLTFVCSLCKNATATKMCANEDDLFCETCMPKHKKTCDSDFLCDRHIPNSPRMGQCGYTGGTIDIERDGNI